MKNTLIFIKAVTLILLLGFLSKTVTAQNPYYTPCNVTFNVDIRYSNNKKGQFQVSKALTLPRVILFQKGRNGYVNIGRYNLHVFNTGSYPNTDARVTVSLYPGSYMVYAEENLYTGNSIRKRISYYKAFNVSTLKSQGVNLHIIAYIYSFRIKTRFNNMPIYVTYIDNMGHKLFDHWHIGNTGMHGPGVINFEISLPYGNRSIIAHTYYNKLQWEQPYNKKIILKKSDWNVIEFTFKNPVNSSSQPSVPAQPGSSRPCQYLLQQYSQASQRYNQTHSSSDKDKMMAAWQRYQDCLQKESRK